MRIETAIGVALFEKRSGSSDMALQAELYRLKQGRGVVETSKCTKNSISLKAL